MKDLVQAVLNGERRGLARALSLVEDEMPEGEALLEALFPHTGRAYRIGVTGPAGVGKSTLVNALAHAYRHREAPVRIAVVAVDPTSPLSGGALLGDRIRMRDLADDPNIFIRSMASRGALGGLARRTEAVLQVLDAAGFSPIFIETVGSGQAEVDIARTAHTVLVVQAPGMGDDIQVLKAGLLEIADILVVNKADLPGAEELARGLRMWVSQREGQTPDTWEPPVLLVQALNREGLDAVLRAIEAHRQYLESRSERLRRERARWEETLRRELLEALWRRVQTSPETAALFRQTVQDVAARRVTPGQAVKTLLARIWPSSGSMDRQALRAEIVPRDSEE